LDPHYGEGCPAASEVSQSGDGAGIARARGNGPWGASAVRAGFSGARHPLTRANAKATDYGSAQAVAQIDPRLAVRTDHAVRDQGSDGFHHAKIPLAVPGPAAVVVPDSPPFEGGRRDDPAVAPARVRRAHAAAAAHRDLLRAARKGERALLRSPARCARPVNRKLWVYDLRTNVLFTLKSNRMKPTDLDSFVARFKPESRQGRRPTCSERNPGGRPHRWPAWVAVAVVGARRMVEVGDA
jgi:hypothetical protein